MIPRLQKGEFLEIKLFLSYVPLGYGEPDVESEAVTQKSREKDLIFSQLGIIKNPSLGDVKTFQYKSAYEGDERTVFFIRKYGVIEASISLSNPRIPVDVTRYVPIFNDFVKSIRIVEDKNRP